MTTLTGTVVNGVVVLDGGPVPPDGTKVDVTVRPAAVPPADANGAPPEGPTHAWLLKFAGKAEGLPPDFAAQHDHYIHGTPKR